MSEATYRLRWRGSEQGPFTVEQIRQQLARREVGLLHEILDGPNWVTLREFFAADQLRLQQERAQAEEAARLSRAQAEQRVQEELVRHQAALAAEEKRKNNLLAAAVQAQYSPGKSRPGLLGIMGWITLLIGLGISIYFLLVFDQSVPTGAGGRVNNFGLMQDRQMGLIFGVALLVVGAVMAIFGRSAAKE